jgi:hypothetical protein
LLKLFEAGRIDQDSFYQELLRHTNGIEQRLEDELRQAADLNTDVTALYRLLRLVQPSLAAPPDPAPIDEADEG